MMQTKELRTNKTMRTGVILTLIAIITLIAIAMTFAKYASQGTGEDSARVAKWGLDQSIPNDLDLFDGKYTKDGSTTVDASDGSNVIAPGTSKTANITLANFTNNEAPEVMYHFEPSITIEDGYVSGTTSLTDKLDALPGWNWTLATNGGTAANYKTVAALKAAVEALQETDIAPNTMPATKTMQLGWTWEFDNSSAAGAWDASDTELGNLIASGQLSGMKVTLNLNAYQCQGCSTNVTLSGKVSQTDGTAVAGANVAYNYSSAANGTISANTDSDGKYSMKVPTNTKGILTITKDGYKETTTGEFSVADQPVEKNVTNFDPKTEIEIPTAITGLKYNGSVQTGVNYVQALIPDTYSYTGDVSATNASKTDEPYKATFSLKDSGTCMWKDSTTADKTIEWTIDKADNPMDLPNQSDTSSVVSDQSVAYIFNAATGTPEELSVTYSVTSSASSQDNFYIPDSSKNVLVCAENTGIEEYTIHLTAKSGNDNYNEKTITKDFKWTVNPKPIQSTFTVTETSGSETEYTVNFLPAVADASWASAGLKFYKKDGDTYTELSGISSMSTLATAIANIDSSKTATENAANVYTDTTGVTFYGTIDRSWNNTFKSTTTSGTSAGLNSTFATALTAASVVKTVYFANNSDTEDTSKGNWNANDKAVTAKTEPNLDGVGYDTFYAAYDDESLLQGSEWAWSSRAYNSSNAYYWNGDEWSYAYGGRTWDCAVVLSRDF